MDGRLRSRQADLPGSRCGWIWGFGPRGAANCAAQPGCKFTKDLWLCRVLRAPLLLWLSRDTKQETHHIVVCVFFVWGGGPLL